MKKVTVFSIIFLIFTVRIFATNIALYESFVEKIIPQELVKPFVERTFNNGNVDIGLELLAVGKKESQWKRKAVGRNRDAEGNILSYDYGPLQLNSSNIEPFSKKYGISWKESNYNSDIYYMCICIDYYKELRTKYSKIDAWRSYNGGEYRVKKNCVREVVKQYAEDVSNFATAFKNDWTKFVSNFYKKFQIAEILKCTVPRKVKLVNYTVAVIFAEKLYWFRKNESTWVELQSCSIEVSESSFDYEALVCAIYEGDILNFRV